MSVMTIFRQLTVHIAKIAPRKQEIGGSGNLVIKKKSVSVFWPMVVLAAALGQQLSGSNPTPDEILDRSVEASGGISANDKVLTILAKGFETDWDNKRTEFEYYFNKKPCKFLMVRREPGKEVKMGFDGEIVWKQDGSQKAKKVTGDYVDDIRCKQSDDLTHWRDTLKHVEFWGTAEVLGRKAYIVRATPRKGRFSDLYFDAQSFLQVREDTTWATAKGFKPVQVYVGDYRAVGDIRIPFEQVSLYQDRRSSAITTEIRLNIPIDDAIFAKPK
jgi:hypothetical protein